MGLGFSPGVEGLSILGDPNYSHAFSRRLTQCIHFQVLVNYSWLILDCFCLLTLQSKVSLRIKL